VKAKLRPPVNFRNPGNMDYVAWLGSQGIAALGSAKSTNVDLLPGVGGSTFERLRWQARRSVLHRMEQLWPAPYAGLFQAMILGERGLVSRELRLEFQRSGTFHLLVVSGMNVAVFAVFLGWALRRMRMPTELTLLATVVLTCAYAALTQLGAPILRSVLMIAAYQVAALLNRDRAPLNTVAVAALALLVWQPAMLFEASFQLTFLAVLTIAGIGVPLFVLTTRPLREALHDIQDVNRDLLLRPRQAQFRLDIREIAAAAGKLVGERAALWLLTNTVLAALAIFELAALSLLMQISLTLPTVCYFHRINVHAAWANMVVLPLTGLLMPASMLAVGCSYVSHWLAWPFSVAARWALAGILLAVHGSGGAQMFDVRVPMPSWWAVAAIAVSYSLALMMARRQRALTAVSFGGAGRGGMDNLCPSASVYIPHQRSGDHGYRHRAGRLISAGHAARTHGPARLRRFAGR
jgi:competence protein ComEC